MQHYMLYRRYLHHISAAMTYWTNSGIKTRTVNYNNVEVIFILTALLLTKFRNELDCNLDQIRQPDAIFTGRTRDRKVCAYYLEYSCRCGHEDSQHYI